MNIIKIGLLSGFLGGLGAVVAEHVGFSGDQLSWWLVAVPWWLITPAYLAGKAKL